MSKIFIIKVDDNVIGAAQSLEVTESRSPNIDQLRFAPTNFSPPTSVDIKTVIFEIESYKTVFEIES